VLDGDIPTRRAAEKLSDEELVERLTAVKGIGRWTVEMFLIFTLGRPDVLPLDDYGVRKGFARAYGRDVLPRPKELATQGERWRPYRTAASWYLWRATELEAS
jgi:DNA-3-methyladenine glycosylase II